MKKLIFMALAIAITVTSFAGNNDSDKGRKKQSTEKCCKKGKCCKPAVKKA